MSTSNADSEDLKQLTNTPITGPGLAWFPDGERLAFASPRMIQRRGSLYTGAPKPYGEIFVMPYDGTQLQRLTDDQWEGGGPAWQPIRRYRPSPQLARNEFKAVRRP